MSANRIGCAALLAGFTLLSFPAGASTQEFQVDIGAGDAPAALRQLVEQTQLQLLFDPAILENRKTSSVSGRLARSEALSRLLAGSGLSFRFVNRETAVVGMRTSFAADGESQTPATVSAGKETPAESPDTTAAPSEADNATQPNGPTAPLPELLILGTHIRGITDEFSPTRTYDRKTIEQSGATNLEQLAQKLPENVSSVISGGLVNQRTNFQASSNAYSGSGFNLRGLGPTSTLVLVDGQRMSSSGETGAFVDVSMIPISALERVEIETDSASAAYGADAVAGVVNLVMRKNFSGAETSGKISGTSDGGAGERAVSQLVGKSWSSGNAMMAYEYYDQNTLLSAQRDFVPSNLIFQTLLPEQRKNGIFVGGRQEVGALTSLSVKGLFADRRSSQTTIQDQFADTSAKQYNATLQLERKLPRGWLGTLSGNFSRSDQRSTSILGGASFTINTLTRLAEAAASADGDVFSAPGGTAKLAVGVNQRKERFSDTFYRPSNGAEFLHRQVSSAFTELFIPLIGSANQRFAARRLALSLSARHDHYEGVGSSTDPKFGVTWEFARGLSFRGTYSTAFRPPLLAEGVADHNFLALQLPDASAPTGSRLTLINTGIGHPGLQPETSRSFTLGFDLKPIALPGLSVGATYFKTKYRNRITIPPYTNLLSVLSETDTLGPFINFSPDSAAIQQIFNEGPIFDLRDPPSSAPLAPSDIQATFDTRPANIGLSRESDLELNVSYQTIPQRYGSLRITALGDYRFQHTFQVLPTTPDVTLLDRVGQPVRLRLRSVLGWDYAGFTSALTLNYTDSYENDYLTPPGRIDSWTTVDMYAGYATAEAIRGIAALSGLAISFTVQNVANKNPPHVATDPFMTFPTGYDAANASPLGRLFAVQISKRW